MVLKSHKDFNLFEWNFYRATGDFGSFSETLNNPENRRWHYKFARAIHTHLTHRAHFNNHIIITNSELAEVLYKYDPNSIFCFAANAITEEIELAEHRKMQDYLGQMKNTNLNTIEGAIEAISLGMPYYKLPNAIRNEKQVILYAIRRQYYTREVLTRAIDFNSIELDEETVETLIDYNLHKRCENFLFDIPEFAELAANKGYYPPEPYVAPPLIVRVKHDLSHFAGKISREAREISQGFIGFANEHMPIWNTIYENLQRKRYIEIYKQRAQQADSYIPFEVYLQIAESIITQTGDYVDLTEKIDLRLILDELARNFLVRIYSTTEYKVFFQEHKAQIYQTYGIMSSDIIDYMIDTYELGILQSMHTELFSPKIVQALGMQNVESICKYILVPGFEFHFNAVLEKTEINNIIKIFTELGGNLENFDENLFRLVVERFSTNYEVMQEYINIENIGAKDKAIFEMFMSINIPKYREIKTLEEFNTQLIDFYKSKLANGTDMQKLAACKDLIFLLKYGMISEGRDLNREEIRDSVRYYLNNILNKQKIEELERQLGADVIMPFRAMVNDWENIININNVEQIVQITQQIIADFQNGKLNSKNGLHLSGEIQSLYGQELKKSLTDLNTILTKTIDSKSGVEVFELNGEPFSILNHTLNAYGTGGSIVQFSDRAIGKAYLCTSLVTNYNMGHADRGEKCIKLGFVQIQPDQFIMSAPRDVWSQGNNNSRFVNSKGGMDCMSSTETSKQTIYTHNEFVIYRDAINGDKIKPNCILCFEEEISDAHREAAQTLGIPIVKINVAIYKEQHQKRIEQLSASVSANPTADTVKEYLYSLTSYISGYAWETNNTPRGDDFLKIEALGDLVDSLLETIRRTDVVNRKACIAVVKTFVDDCTKMRQSHYDFLKRKKGEILRIEESCLSSDQPEIINNNLEELRIIKEQLLSETILEEDESKKSIV